jgi:hypothetical protein
MQSGSSGVLAKIDGRPEAVTKPVHVLSFLLLPGIFVKDYQRGGMSASANDEADTNGNEMTSMMLQKGYEHVTIR